VKTDDLRITSNFGRISADHLSSRLAQLGYTVVEPRVRAAFAMNATGQFILSQEVEQVGRSVGASAVVTGTYARSSDHLYVSLRIITLSDKQIVSTFDYVVWLDRTIRAML
jgi:TolB-like protein